MSHNYPPPPPPPTSTTHLVISKPSIKPPTTHVPFNFTPHLTLLSLSKTCKLNIIISNQTSGDTCALRSNLRRFTTRNPGHSMRDCGSTVIKNFGASIKFLRWKLGEKVNFLDGYVLLFGWVYICCPSLLTGSEFVGWAGSVPGFVIGSGFALRSGSSPGLHSELLVLSSEFFFWVCSWFIYPSLEGLCVRIWCAAQFV
ncbi:hypothetical protein HanRHA438_Chr05g0216151 [Helianthus annuus]|nr:hypothetical protein HanRHA438_Chr05g0216151 [Helianthus annuus]